MVLMQPWPKRQRVIIFLIFSPAQKVGRELTNRQCPQGIQLPAEFVDQHDATVTSPHSHPSPTPKPNTVNRGTSSARQQGATDTYTLNVR